MEELYPSLDSPGTIGFLLLAGENALSSGFRGLHWENSQKRLYSNPGSLTPDWPDTLPQARELI